MSIAIDLPDEIGDESAARISDVLHELGDAFYRLGGAVETRYAGQIDRVPPCGVRAWRRLRYPAGRAGTLRLPRRAA